MFVTSPKTTCKSCGQSIQCDRQPILKPLSHDELGLFLTGSNDRKRLVVWEGIVSNLARLREYPLTAKEIYDDLFGNTPWIDREAAEGLILLTLTYQDFRHDQHQRFIPKPEF